MNVQQATEAVRQYIKRKYETQGQAAQHMGFSRQYVSQVLTGESNPSHKILAFAGLKKITTITYEAL